MSAQGVHVVTEQFEAELCRYTGAPYAVAVDNCSNALFLALVRTGIAGREVSIPANTYPSVPCEIIHAGGVVVFDRFCSDFINTCRDSCTMTTCNRNLRGAYQLGDTGVYDSALRFTAGQYVSGQTQCLSFTGPYKHLKLGKGGAILTDSAEDAAWYKRARFSGRRECSYHDDQLDMLGWNFYMMPEVALRGLQQIAGMWRDGKPVENADLCLPFPDLSRFPIYTQARDFVSQRYVVAKLDGLEYGFRLRSHVGAQSFDVTPEAAVKIGEGLLRETERAGVQIRAVVPAPAEPYPDYDAYRGNP